MENLDKSKLKIVLKDTVAERRKLEQELMPKDRSLRFKLEEELPDDKVFLEIVHEISDNLQRLSSIREGIDRARTLASFFVLINKLKKTERSILSREFVKISEEIRKNSSRAIYRKQSGFHDKVA